MSRVCQVTGAKPSSGHNVSHSNKKTKRWFEVNVQSKRYYVPSLGRSVKLTVSPKGMKTIDRRGIDAVVADLRKKGVDL